MHIRDLQAEVHEIAKSKGFWDKERNIGEMIALCHEELSEALREIREGNDPREIYSVGEFKIPEEINNEIYETPAKPAGFPIELADVIIRVLDLAGGLGIDIEEAITAKVAYNKIRDRLHGKRF